MDNINKIKLAYNLFSKILAQMLENSSFLSKKH